MAKLPFMKFYVDDYLADTVRLTPMEHGCYMLLIIEYWRTQKSILNDDEELADICRCSVDDFGKVKRRVLKFFHVKRDRLVHNRVERLIEESKEAYEKRRSAGKKGGLNKAKAIPKQSYSNASPMLKQPEPEPEPIKNNSNNREIEIVEKYKSIFVETLNGYVQPIQNLSQNAANNLVDLHRSSTFIKGDFEQWRLVCKKVLENPWYLGENKSGRVIQLEWLSDEENMIKVLNYQSDKPKGDKTKTKSQQDEEDRLNDLEISLIGREEYDRRQKEWSERGNK